MSKKKTIEILIDTWEAKWILGSIDDSPLSCMASDQLGQLEELAKKLRNFDGAWAHKILGRIAKARKVNS